MTSLLEAPLVYWRAGGTLLLPLAAVCYGIWFYFLRMQARLACETDAVARLSAQLEHGGCERVDVAGEAGVLVEEALAAGGDGPAVFEERSEVFLAALRRDLGMLGALTVVAPLLGLLGTVMGMIATFDAVAVSGGDTARWVAEGVSRALITTQAGLAIAIPGVFGMMYLRRRLSRLQVRLGTLWLHIFEMASGRAA